MKRRQRCARSAEAGCFQCSGDRTRWHGRTAKASAAKHSDATGHETWAASIDLVRYGHAQLSLFDAAPEIRIGPR